MHGKGRLEHDLLLVLDHLPKLGREIIRVTDHSGHVRVVLAGRFFPRERLVHIQIRVNVKIVRIEIAGELLQDSVFHGGEADRGIGPPLEQFGTSDHGIVSLRLRYTIVHLWIRQSVDDRGQNVGQLVVIDRNGCAAVESHQGQQAYGRRLQN